MCPEFDLLGDPVPPGRGKRGRPQHLPTDEKRRLIIQLAAFSFSEDKMAAALGITPPTLRRHYFRELKSRTEARFRVEAKLLTALMAEVEKGNVSAIDKYFKRLDRHDLGQPLTPRSKTKKPKPGKKEEANIAAHDAHVGTSWGNVLN